MPGNDDPVQEPAFPAKQLYPPTRDPVVVRWVCGYCGSPRVRADQVAVLDPRYTTGTCMLCRRDRPLVRHPIGGNHA
jgi:hypothetical protein